MEEIDKTRRFLKARLKLDKTLFAFEKERSTVKDLLMRTATESESNSAILIGPKNSGKTTVSALFQFSK